MTNPMGAVVAQVCRSLLQELDVVTERLNHAITSEIPEFKPGNTVYTAEDLWWSTSRNGGNFLRGIAEDRGPLAEDLSFFRLISHRSVALGFPLQPLITSFHIGVRELYASMVERAAEMGGDAPAAMLTVGPCMWEWMLASMNALADEYDERARLEAFATRTTSKLMDAVVRDPVAEDARSLASELGFQPDGAFTVMALIAAAWEDSVRAITVAVQDMGASARSTQRGRISVVIVQGVETEKLVDTLAPWAPTTPIGIGRRHDGLAGARVSFFEAESALELGVVRGKAVHFEDDWLAALAVSGRDSVGGLLRQGIDVAAAKPHLAAAVRAFAHNGFSVAEGARQMLLSQNSFRYRLTRWQALTGWDPWTYDGLTRSLTALELAQ